MATIYKSVYKRFNGTDWDTHYFKTSADVIEETTSYKILKASERTSIETYLATFNAANKLLKLDGDGLVPESLIPGGLGYLPLNGGTMTGGLDMGGNTITVNTLTGNSLIAMSITAGTSLNLNAGGTNGSIFLTPTGTGVVDVGGKRITDLDEPTSLTDAATKKYVDLMIEAGLNVASAPVKAATDSISVSVGSGLPEIDGYQTVSGDRILLFDQSSPEDNGIYEVSAAAWIKDVSATKGTMVFVEEGNNFNDWLFVNKTGTTWVEFTKPDTITAAAGGGLERTGNSFGIATSGVSNSMLAGSITLAKLANFASADSDAWGSIAPAATSNSMDTKLRDIFSAIKNLRGTANYNTSNAETLSGAYTLIDAKIQSYVANDGGESSIPTPTTGDLFFGTIS